MSSVYIEDNDLAVAWGTALLAATQPIVRDLLPLVVSITGFSPTGVVTEDGTIRSSLDRTLSLRGLQSAHTVANTIFPRSLWNPAAPRSALFSRYQAILPRLHAASAKNRHGLYFERMLSGGPVGSENQLEFALSAFSARAGVRRSILQIGVFQPARDHSTAAMLGFPCLQHLTFAPTRDGLNVNAFLRHPVHGRARLRELSRTMPIGAVRCLRAEYAPEPRNLLHRNRRSSDTEISDPESFAGHPQSYRGETEDEGLVMRANLKAEAGCANRVLRHAAKDWRP